MKKPNKIKEDKPKRERFITFVDPDTAQWIRQEAEKYDRKESDFIRITLKAAQDSEDKP